MKRFLSLDIFRGMTVAGMILVNNPGSWGNIFPPLRHAKWDGCTPTDLVFPFFLFAVGAAIWFSNRKTNHELSPAVVKKIIKRGLLIFVVGLLLNWYPFFSFGVENPVSATIFGNTQELYSPWSNMYVKLHNLRILGVLQRIGIAFMFGALLALWLKSYKKIAIALGSILAGYWILVFAFGDATLENFIGKTVDEAIFGVRHIYKGYGIPFDPEGLFSTIPAIGTVLLGYMAGKLMGESTESPLRGIITMAAAGGLLITLGLIMNPYFPINKPIWSSSYVLYAGGLAMQAWAILAYIIDYRQKTRWTTFFNVFGTNALFAFVLSGFLAKTWGMPLFTFMVGEKKFTIFSWYYSIMADLTTPKIGSLICALTMVMLCWIITYPLYRKKIFIKL